MKDWIFGTLFVGTLLTAATYFIVTRDHLTATAIALIALAISRIYKAFTAEE